MDLHCFAPIAHRGKDTQSGAMRLIKVISWFERLPGGQTMVISLFSMATRWVSLANILWNLPTWALSSGIGASIQMSLMRGEIGKASIISDSKLYDCVCRLFVRGNGTGTFLREISILDRNESRESNVVVFVAESLFCSAIVSGIGVRVLVES